MTLSWDLAAGVKQAPPERFYIKGLTSEMGPSKTVWQPKRSISTFFDNHGSDL